MLIQKPTPEPYLSTPSPDRSPPLSSVFTEYETGDDDVMSAEEPPPSRPMSFAPSEMHAMGPYCPRMPTLSEILSNSAPPPWTLSAFTAYLSQNHCLENLEFVKDAERYRRRYAEAQHDLSSVLAPLDEAAPADAEPLPRLWARMVHSYLEPETPREINIPSDVRDALLSYETDGSAEPPPPEALDPAIKVVNDLMNESILMSFIHELSPRKPPSSIQEWDEMMDDSTATGRRSSDRSRGTARLSRSPSGHRSPVPDTMSTSAPGQGKTSVSSIARSVTSGRSASNKRGPRSAGPLPTSTSTFSAESGDIAIFSDDALSTGSPIPSPMTPPTTPPASDQGGTSPKGVNRGDTAWRKMMGRLGSKRKPSGRGDRMDLS